MAPWSCSSAARCRTARAGSRIRRAIRPEPTGRSGRRVPRAVLRGALPKGPRRCSRPTAAGSRSRARARFIASPWHAVRPAGASGNELARQPGRAGLQDRSVGSPIRQPQPDANLRGRPARRPGPRQRSAGAEARPDDGSLLRRIDAVVPGRGCGDRRRARVLAQPARRHAVHRDQRHSVGRRRSCGVRRRARGMDSVLHRERIRWHGDARHADTR